MSSRFLKSSVVAVAAGAACLWLANPALAAGDISLRVVVYTSNPSQLALLNSIADEFKAANPDVANIAFESILVGSLDTKLTTELQSNDPPDVSWMTVVNSARYIDGGALVDLAPTLKASEDFDYADLIQPTLQRWQRGDAQYGMPFSTSSQVLFYNADLFKLAGTPNPDELIKSGQWDWDHFAKGAKAISDSQKVPGYSYDFSKSPELLYSMMYAYDAEPWDASADKCTANSPQMTAAMTLLHSMMYTDHSTSLPGQLPTFFDGKAGATIAYLSSTPLLKEAKFNWGVVPTPAGPDGFHAAIGQSAFVAFAKGKHPDVAAKFIAFVTNPENSAKLSAYWVPARASQLTAEKLHENLPLLSEEQFEPIVKATVETGKVVPVSKNGGAAQTVMLSAFNQYLFMPDVDVKAALDDVCTQLQPALRAR